MARNHSLLSSLIVCIGMIGWSANDALAQPSESEPAEVMVLGTFHFNGGGQDYINPEVDNYLSDERQAEIELLVEQLAEFQPNKIAVELSLEHEDRFNELYEQFRQGEHTLTVNERQQIGMRLAAILGHDWIYAVDYNGSGMDFETMFASANEEGQLQILGRLDTLQQDITSLEASLNSPNVSVMERLRHHNMFEFQQRHDVYMSFAQIGSREDPVGAVEMTHWWGRNLIIFGNIAKISEPGDRILVIYGSGHKYLLDEFFDHAAEFVLVDSLEYLE